MSTRLQLLDEGLWVAESSHGMLGLQLGSRMTVLRLSSGGLWIHSPVALDETLRREIDALGSVEHIVAPNLYHHVYASSAVEAYPEAKLWGVAGLARKRKDLTFTGVLDSDSGDHWGGDPEAFMMAGTMLGETVFLHRATRTLICCDLIENFLDCAHGPTRLYLKASGIWRKPGLSRFLRPLFRDRSAARASVDRLLELDFDRIVLSHGEVLESGGPSQLRATYEWLKI